jgi:hypothetical protein
MELVKISRTLWDCINVDPHGNHNNHDALLIYRSVYRANAQLIAIENDTLARINEIAKEVRHTLERH